MDIACGSGRHTLLLAGRSQHVTAVDWSGVALDVLETRARAAHFSTRRISSMEKTGNSLHSGIDLMQADLTALELPENSFELILCIQYLQRAIFAQLPRALRPGGFLLFETFTRAQLEFARGPRNPDYLLESGELRDAFAELRVLFYRELRAGQGIASLLAQKPGSKN